MISFFHNVLINPIPPTSAVAKFMNSCQAGLSHRGVRFGGSTMAGLAWFDVIALATSKGGVGKSTLARARRRDCFGDQKCFCTLERIGEGGVFLGGRLQSCVARQAAPALALPLPLSSTALSDVGAQIDSTLCRRPR